MNKKELQKILNNAINKNLPEIESFDDPKQIRLIRQSIRGEWLNKARKEDKKQMDNYIYSKFYSTITLSKKTKSKIIALKGKLSYDEYFSKIIFEGEAN